MINKPDLFKYLAGDQDDDWGIDLTTIGYYHAAPYTAYPPPGHPKTHAFNWKNGRNLNEYHMIYVPTGAGHFETRQVSTKISAGDLILIYKNEWHRYKPQKNTGWETYWLGFAGSYIEKNVCGKLFTKPESVLKSVGNRTDVIALFDQLIELSTRESPLFKAVSLGFLLQLVACAADRGEVRAPIERNSILAENTITYIRQHLFADIDFHEFAASLHLSYSRFRSIFKSVTGIAPHQFLINERIACAKRLLKNPGNNLKTIGYKAGFRSPSYFSKAFRRKTGNSPTMERTKRS
jgi:AraC-like DNA-binding protein